MPGRSRKGIELPTGVKSRAEVVTARDNFLRANRWSPQTVGWAALGLKPPDTGAMSREQMRSETRQFMRTHHGDEVDGAWVGNTAGMKRS